MGPKMNTRKTEFLSTIGKAYAFHKRRPLGISAHFVIEMGKPGKKQLEVKCPVPGCTLERTNLSSQPSRMRGHFIHSQGIVARCERCGATGIRHDTKRHRHTKVCRLELRRYQRYRGDLTEQASREVVFNVGGEEIKRVREFKCLGRIESEDDDDTPAIEANLKKRKEKGSCMKTS